MGMPTYKARTPSVSRSKCWQSRWSSLRVSQRTKFVSSQDGSGLLTLYTCTAQSGGYLHRPLHTGRCGTNRPPFQISWSEVSRRSFSSSMLVEFFLCNICPGPMHAVRPSTERLGLRAGWGNRRLRSCFGPVIRRLPLLRSLSTVLVAGLRLLRRRSWYPVRLVTQLAEEASFVLDPWPGSRSSQIARWRCRWAMGRGFGIAFVLHCWICRSKHKPATWCLWS